MREGLFSSFVQFLYRQSHDSLALTSWQHDLEHDEIACILFSNGSLGIGILDISYLNPLDSDLLLSVCYYSTD